MKYKIEKPIFVYATIEVVEDAVDEYGKNLKEFIEEYQE